MVSDRNERKEGAPDDSDASRPDDLHARVDAISDGLRELAARIGRLEVRLDSATFRSPIDSAGQPAFQQPVLPAEPLVPTPRTTTAIVTLVGRTLVVLEGLSSCEPSPTPGSSRCGAAWLRAWPMPWEGRHWPAFSSSWRWEWPGGGTSAKSPALSAPARG